MPESDTAPVHQLLIQLLPSSHLWSSLHPGPVCPYVPIAEDFDSNTEEIRKGEVSARTCFGNSQPQVRRAAWALVESIVDPKRGTRLVPGMLCDQYLLCITQVNCHLVFCKLCLLLSYAQRGWRRMPVCEVFSQGRY